MIFLAQLTIDRPVLLELFAAGGSIVIAIFWDLILTRKWSAGGWLNPDSRGEAAFRLTGFSLFLLSSFFEGWLGFAWSTVSLALVFLAAYQAYKRCPHPLSSPIWTYLLTVIVSVLPRQLAGAGKVLGINRWLVWAVLAFLVLAPPILAKTGI